jgi:hypothetical protein
MCSSKSKRFNRSKQRQQSLFGSRKRKDLSFLRSLLFEARVVTAGAIYQDRDGLTTRRRAGPEAAGGFYHGRGGLLANAFGVVGMEFFQFAGEDVSVGRQQQNKSFQQEQTEPAEVVREKKTSPFPPLPPVQRSLAISGF